MTIDVATPAGQPAHASQPGASQLGASQLGASQLGASRPGVLHLGASRLGIADCDIRQSPKLGMKGL
jgi:hypothetical protein